MQDLLKKVHFTWLGLGGLWLVALLAGLVAALVPKQPSFSYGPPPSHKAESFFIFLFIVYVVAGFVLGKLHNRHTANFTNASFTRQQSGSTTIFHISPAPRHFPFWVIGMFGAFFLCSLPSALTGGGIGLFSTLVLAALLYFLGLQPKLWRPIPPHSFSIGPTTVEADGRTVPVGEIKALVIVTGLPGKSDKYPQAQQATYTPPATQTVHVGPGVNPLAAHGMAAATQVGVGASAAAGQGIAEVANRYFYEMRARSWRVEAVMGGKNLVLAKGLDPQNAEALLAQAAALLPAPA